MANKVRVNSVYYFDPVPFDRCNGNSTELFKRGEKVRVINLHGCPPANTMGMCYIVSADAVKDSRGKYKGDFAMVMTNSLEKEPPAPSQPQPDPDVLVFKPEADAVLKELFGTQPATEQANHEQQTVESR